MKKNQHTDLPVLEYKGFKGLLEYNARDNGRIYGKICPPESPDIPLDSWGYAGDSVDDIRKTFESQVESIIWSREYNDAFRQWLKVTDYESIICVQDILPDRFEKRVKEGKFDMSLLDGVKGGCYVVPLYYVTKAWETILKGRLEPMDYWIGPEEEDDCTEEAIAVFLKEKNATRSRCEACRDNDRMKELWLELFDIDLDSIEIDFHQFDMHLPPKVSMDTYEKHFNDIPNGINEWILDNVNHTDGTSTAHDEVSALMEFTAQVLLWREDKLIYY